MAFHNSSPVGEVHHGYVLEYGRARVHVLARSIATVLRVDGDIDWCNAEQTEQAIRRFFALNTPLIVDLSHLDFLGVSGYRMFVVMDDERRRAQIPLVIVFGEAARWLRRVPGADALAMARSVTEGLELINEFTCKRRRLLPALPRPAASVALLSG